MSIMMLLLSLLAGSLSTLSPCVLPVLPIILSSALQASRFGPLALLSGVVLSYTVTGSALALVGVSLAGGAQLRLGSAVLMVLLGVLLLMPALQASLIKLATPVSTRANHWMASIKGDGWSGQALLGVLLGVVWSPCVGPTLGAAVAMAGQRDTAWQAVMTMFAFGVGAAIPMALLAYGTRAMRGKRQQMVQVGQWGKRTMGASLLAVGLLVGSGADRFVETFLTAHMPAWLLDLSTRF